MPKETFFNLSEDKREKIIDRALEEFAIHDYKSASLSRIVEKAGISKGSMYQYFDNKKDLYFYLLDVAANHKLGYISRNLDLSIKDFYEMYKQMIFTGAKYDLSYLSYSRLMYNAGKESYNEEIGDVASSLLNRSQEYLRQFVEGAKTQGQVRADIDTDFIAFIISRLSVDIGDYINVKYNISYADAIKTGSERLPITDEQLGNVLDELIKFFKTGLGR